ncbi:Hypothetical predicted protein [Olea europaea subsp. europaea]|uniref:Uncharacterized protein n=1 Tax=Olea europaea subsp. europaea TaxID=158383 RepID=A0A8S0QWW8_OLEEU|nr:Hypothetical predicted protein [Olea europaea subsp. europaea]
MAQEFKYICLRDILKKEKFPKLGFFEYSPSESEVESDYPSAKIMEVPTPSPFAMANYSSQDERRFKLALLYDDCEDEEEKQMKKEEDEETPYEDADNEGKGCEEDKE